MKVNIENMVRQSCKCMKGDFADLYKYTLTEFIDNLKELKKAHKNGDGEKVLDEFFNLYVFSQ